MTNQSSTAIPPVGTPVYGCGFLLAIKRLFRGYTQFKGKSSRSEFWWAYLAVSVLAFVAMLLAAFIGGLIASTITPSDPSYAYVGGLIGLAIGLVFLALVFPLLAAASRRLRDAGFSPLYLLFCLIFLSIVPLIMCIFETKHSDNRA